MAPRNFGAVTFVNFARRIATAFGVQGDFPGAVMPNIQPVSIADDLTDQRSLWPLGGSSWEASGLQGQDGANYPAVMLTPRVTGLDPQKVQRLIRIRELSFWSNQGNAVGQIFGWTTLDRNQAVPALAGGATDQPMRRDTRQAFSTAGTSLYAVSKGLATGANNAPTSSSTRFWARRYSGSNANAGVAAVRFDPKITLRVGDIFWLGIAVTNSEIGYSIAWDEIPCSEQENFGDNP